MQDNVYRNIWQKESCPTPIIYEIYFIIKKNISQK